MRKCSSLRCRLDDISSSLAKSSLCLRSIHLCVSIHSVGSRNAFREIRIFTAKTREREKEPGTQQVELDYARVNDVIYHATWVIWSGDSQRCWSDYDTTGGGWFLSAQIFASSLTIDGWITGAKRVKVVSRTNVRFCTSSCEFPSCDGAARKKKKKRKTRSRAIFDSKCNTGAIKGLRRGPGWNVFDVRYAWQLFHLVHVAVHGDHDPFFPEGLT